MGTHYLTYSKTDDGRIACSVPHGKKVSPQDTLYLQGETTAVLLRFTLNGKAKSPFKEQFDYEKEGVIAVPEGGAGKPYTIAPHSGGRGPDIYKYTIVNGALTILAGDPDIYVGGDGLIRVPPARNKPKKKAAGKGKKRKSKKPAPAAPSTKQEA